MHVPDPEPGGVLFLDRTMPSRYQPRWLVAPLAVRVLTGRGGAIAREIQRCGVRRYRDLTVGCFSEGMRMTALENGTKKPRRTKGSITRWLVVNKGPLDHLFFSAPDIERSNDL
jgi:hypothetical protein